MYSRRELFCFVPAAGLLPPLVLAANSSRAPVKAVAFDGFAIFDAHPVFSLVDELFPEKGKELASLWRARQFEYMWLRSLSRHYSDFGSVTADALVFAANALRLNLTAEHRSRLMDAWLTPLLDGCSGLYSRIEDCRLAGWLLVQHVREDAGITDSKLWTRGFLRSCSEYRRVRAYKPDPRAYRMAVDAFRLRREEIAFVASAGWDAAGARNFGYWTFWANRQNQPAEELGAADIATGATLSDLVVPLTGQRKLAGQIR